jgi:hypothetical protein
LLYVDLPTPSELIDLVKARDPESVSIYVPTTNVTQDIDGARIEFGNLARAALDQLEAVGIDKRVRALLEATLGDLEGDDDFWAHQATSLAVFATPGRLRTYRLPTRLSGSVHVADRFHLKPLYRLASQPDHAFVLALEENGVRLIEVFSDMAPQEIKVPGMPKDAASATGRSNVGSRSARGRLQGSEGEAVRLRQYARKVDDALRPLLSGRTEPLILAAAAPIGPIYRGVASYPSFAAEGIDGSPTRMSPLDIAQAARPIVDGLHALRVAEIAALYNDRAGSGRASGDIAMLARAATFGAVDTLVADIDAVIPGLVDEETGEVTFAEAAGADSYGVVDEIAGRVLLNGGTVIGVRREEVPGGGTLAGLLRYAF